MNKYSLIDFNSHQKLEKLGELTICRPIRLDKAISSSLDNWNPDMTFSLDRKSWDKDLPASFSLLLDDIVFQAKINNSGNIGFFPEHIALYNTLKETNIFEGRQLKVLNLFAYTGTSVLKIIKNEEIDLTNIDSSRSSLNLLHENLLLNEIHKPVRNLVEDSMLFTKRENRRGNKYDLIISDPPTTGRDNKGKLFKLEDSWREHLVDLTQILSTDSDSLIVFTHHTSSLNNSIIKTFIENLGFNTSIEESFITDTFGKKLPCGYRMLIKRK